jgi:hypothetical protein
MTKDYGRVTVIFDRCDGSSFFFNVRPIISDEELKEFRDLLSDALKGVDGNNINVEANNESP